ncbi:MAG: PAS domain S-box protein, partial [Bradymonadaceae bacterium]
MFHHLPNPVVHGSVEDGDVIVRDVNPAFEQTFGLEKKRIVGESLYDSFLLEEQSRDEELAPLIEQLQQTGEVHEDVRRKTVHGARDFRLDITAVPSETGVLQGYGIYTDITDRKERERRRERRYKAIFNHTYQFTGLLE